MQARAGAGSGVSGQDRQNLSRGTVLVGALVWASGMFGVMLHGGAAAESMGKRR